MAVIESIDALIHPDFSLMKELTRKDPFVSFPTETALRQSWDLRVEEIATNPKRRFIYLPWLDQNKLDTGTGFKNAWEEMDYERIQKYRKLLGDQMFVSSMTLSKEMSEVILSSGEINNSTKLYALGHWTEQCVRSEAKKIATSLGIAEENLTVVPELSKFSWQGVLLFEAHRDLREEDS